MTDQPPTRDQLQGRMWLAVALPLLALVVFLFRLWYLQVVRGAEIRARASSMRTSSVPLPAPRGLIVDRTGHLLAGVRAEAVVMVAPATAKAHPQVLDFLAERLGVSRDVLEDKVSAASWRPYMPAPVFVGADPKAAIDIAESGFTLPGVEVDFRPMRYYPDPVSAAHVLGYVWTPSERDVERLAKQGIKASEYVGKVGLEAVYEGALMGASGRERLEVDHRGKPVRLASRDNAVQGNRLVLGLNYGLQQAAMRLLGDRVGAAVMIDVRSGEVLCLASSPSYDASQFEGGISSADFKRLSDDPDVPLLNRAIRGFYAPGSTFKIVVTLAASSVGQFDPNRSVFCAGYYEVGNRKVKCLGRHGAIAFHDAMVHSCNAYFADLALKAGKQALCDTAVAVGLSAKTGIDLIGEGRGIVPTDEWLRQVRKLPEDGVPKWYRGDTVNLGIGQGELAVTPLQMAQVAAIVAQEGHLRVPHLLKAMEAPTGAVEAPTFADRLAISAPPGVWAALKAALVDVVEQGTARGAKVQGLVWAGKTGSTEHVSSSKTHSWFIGYAPANRPEVAIAVLVERAGHGGEVAAPVAGTLINQYFADQARSASEAEVSVAMADAQNLAPSVFDAAR